MRAVAQLLSAADNIGVNSGGEFSAVINGEDVFLWSLDWFSADLLNSGLQMAVVDDQYLGMLTEYSFYTSTFTEFAAYFGYSVNIR